jgi:tetratricopeptide (TPR) repeat protein
MEITYFQTGGANPPKSLEFLLAEMPGAWCRLGKIFQNSPIFMSNENKTSPLKNWRVWVALVVIPIIGFAAWRGGLTVYGEFLKWQSNRLGVEAAALVASGNAAEASRTARESLEYNPANPESLRLLASLQIEAGEDLAAMDTFQKLSATRAFSAADAEGYARLAGRLKKWEVADSLLRALRAGPKTVETPILEADLAEMRGDIPRAEVCLREAVILDPTPKSRLLLADFLIANRLDLQTTPEVYELLVETNRLTTPAGAQFLATALDKNLAPPVEVPRWIEQLRAHSNSTAAMLQVADTAEIRRDPAAKAKVVEALFSRLRNAPLEDRRAGMLWLLANGEPARAADLLQRGEAIQQADLFNAWLDALALANRPEAVLEALEAPNPLRDWRKALQVGRAQRLTGRSSSAEAAYSQALTLAQADPVAALEAVEFFGKAGERGFFESALSRLVLDPAQAPQAHRVLLPIVRGWRDTAGLRRFCEVLAASPGLPEDQRALVQNEIAYCDLVLGRKVDAAAIESQAAAHPGDLRFQTTRALSLLRGGKSEQAVEELVITRAPPDDPFLLARHKALQAMALAANGDRERAEMHFTGLTVEFLSPQEAALVRSFLKKSPR